MLYPETGTGEFVGAAQIKLTSCCTEVPVPLRFTILVLPEVELLEIKNLPEAVPALVGSNCTWTLTAMFGFRVIGNVAPEKLNPAPAMLAALTVTADVPVEVRETGSVSAVPTGSLPKLRLLLLKVRTGSELVPVPLRLTVFVLLIGEVLEMVIVPLAAPVTVGSKPT